MQATLMVIHTWITHAYKTWLVVTCGNWLGKMCNSRFCITGDRVKERKEGEGEGEGEGGRENIIQLQTAVQLFRPCWASSVQCSYNTIIQQTIFFRQYIILIVCVIVDDTKDVLWHKLIIDTKDALWHKLIGSAMCTNEGSHSRGSRS